MHDASGKTAPHPEGAGCLCLDAHWVPLAKGKNTPVFRLQPLSPSTSRLPLPTSTLSLQVSETHLTWCPTLPPTTLQTHCGKSWLPRAQRYRVHDKRDFLNSS